jgi:hypothetical protein
MGETEDEKDRGFSSSKTAKSIRPEELVDKL